MRRPRTVAAVPNCSGISSDGPARCKPAAAGLSGTLEVAGGARGRVTWRSRLNRAPARPAHPTATVLLRARPHCHCRRRRCAPSRAGPLPALNRRRWRWWAPPAGSPSAAAQPVEQTALGVNGLPLLLSLCVALPRGVCRTDLHVAQPTRCRPGSRAGTRLAGRRRSRPGPAAAIGAAPG